VGSSSSASTFSSSSSSSLSTIGDSFPRSSDSPISLGTLLLAAGVPSPSSLKPAVDAPTV
jgi:hypothetical protein